MKIKILNNETKITIDISVSELIEIISATKVKTDNTRKVFLDGYDVNQYVPSTSIFVEYYKGFGIYKSPSLDTYLVYFTDKANARYGDKDKIKMLIDNQVIRLNKKEKA